MKLIGNEVAYAKKCLHKGIIDKKQNAKTLIILAKYYYNLNKDEQEIKDLLNEFLDRVPNKFNRNYLDELVNNIVKSAPTLNVVEKVCITEAEMRVINTRESEQERRVLFTLLVHYKVKNALYPQNNYKVSEERSMIFKDAKVTCSQQEKRNIMGRLHEDGIISIPNNPNDSRITLNYVNDDSPIEIEVVSFDDFILDYYKYKGSKIINCKECGERTMVKSNKTQYCSECSKEKQKEHKRKCAEKTRKNQ